MLSIPYLPEQGLNQAMAQLLQSIRACMLCADRLPLGPRPVVRLHQQSRLLIISQAPGSKVHQTGIPWDDQSGKRLREWLQMDEATFYNEFLVSILPSGFCYPGKGPQGDLPPCPRCTPQWHPQAMPLFEHKPLILLIGQYALKNYLGNRMKPTLAQTVQAFEEYVPDGFFPLPHPSPRNLALRTWTWFPTQVLPVLQALVLERLTPQ